VSHRHLDVLTVTDLRLPGGTAASVAEELRAQAAVGWRSGLLQVDSPLVQHARPLNPRLAALIDDGTVELIVGRDAPVSCRVLVLRHPSVVAALDPTVLPTVVADRVVMVANQSPGTPAGDPVHYDPTAVDAHLRTWLGRDVDVVWAPIGPLVRENLALIAPSIRQADADWVNVIDVAAWAVDRTDAITGTPVIGRHSRNSPHKWPADRATMLAAYPPDDGFAVEVLGGATPAEDVLGGALPRNWRVRRFGTVPPERFLAGVDVFVYFHHPDWVEAFGRTILEALASGAPVIVPHHFAPVFGDACWYATPDEVAGIVRRLAAQPDEYRAWSERGRAFVDEHFGHGVHVGRVAALLGEPAPTAPAVTPTAAHGPRVLFVSSNGAGVGHLMRLMSMARRAEELEPVFLTLSQAITVVREQGYPVEYLASRQYTDVPVAAWHRLLRDRVVDLIDRHQVTAIVFDGTWPYRGLFEAVQERPDVHLVWSRRAMWREGITNPMLDEADRFSLILEPGEVASDADRGITTYLRDGAERVAPITFLDHTDQVDRATARAEMGLDPDRPAALVQLGAGNINDTSSLVGMVVAALAERPELQICVTRSVIASDPGDLGADVRTISVYPLARYLSAFDLAVAASGYNTYHELVAAPVPTLFIPNLETSTDDQTGRARFAERVGIGRALVEVTPEGLERALAPLLDPDQRRRMRELAEGRRLDNGAGAAIRAIERLVTSGTRPPAAAQRPVKQRGTAKLAPGAPVPSPPAAAPTTPAGATSGPGRPSPASRTSAAAVTARRVATSPRVTRLARSVYDRLPATTQDTLRDTLGIARPARRAAGGSDRLPIPPGDLLPEGERVDLDGVVLLLDETLDGAALRDVVDLVAALQVTHRGFAPLFVTGSADAGTFRRFGYQFEYLPDATTWARLSDEDDRRDHLRVRLADIVRRYEAHAVVPVASIDDVRRLVVPVVT
jgi:hypothetical protein